MKNAQQRVRRDDSSGTGAAESSANLDYASLLEALHGYVFVADACGRVQLMNRAPTGFTMQRFLGCDLPSLVLPEHRTLIGDAVEEIANGGSTVELEVQGNQTGRWYHVRIAGIRERGKITGYAVHSIDIDDVKHLEMENGALRARLYNPETESDPARNPLTPFQTMVDALPVLIAYVDSNGCYQYNNAAYERWFGVSREQLRGKTVEEVVGAKMYQRIRSHVLTALAGEPVTFDVVGRDEKRGTHRVIARYVPNFTRDGAPNGFFSLVQDVTALAEAEAALRQRDQELRQLQKMEALGRFAGGIAHDFNNLLMAIMGGCTMIQRAAQPGSAIATQAAEIQQTAHRGASLTRQLLSFSRQSERRLQAMDLDLVIGDVQVLLTRLLESNIRLEASLNASCHILGDTGEMQQVLMNLVINARDAMPVGGTIRIDTTRVLIARSHDPLAPPLEPGPYVLLTVSDTGSGMDEATLKQIFDPFFTTKPPERGTGLGLSTVYGIVQKVGGHIEAESTPGEGTTFRLYFPVAEDVSG